VSQAIWNPGAMLAPGSAAANAGYRLLLAVAAGRLRGQDRSSRAVARALRTTALGQVPPAERAWLGRIAGYRGELADGAITANADPTHGLDPHTHQEQASAACLWMSLPPLLGSLLTRLVRELEPRSCLELGTGFGVSTSYQAAALDLNGSGRLVTLDVEGMQRIAGPGLAGIGLGDRVTLRSGQIEETLAGAIADVEPIDFALLDADHTEAGTMGAFEQLLPCLGAGAVLVFDDIAWTEEMRRAWRRIAGHPRIADAVAIRRLGIAVAAEAATS
jgi:predicted O-methyltransferase YrrM